MRARFFGGRIGLGGEGGAVGCGAVGASDAANLGGDFAGGSWSIRIRAHEFMYTRAPRESFEMKKRTSS